MVIIEFGAGTNSGVVRKTTLFLCMRMLPSDQNLMGVGRLVICVLVLSVIWRNSWSYSLGLRDNEV